MEPAHITALAGALRRGSDGAWVWSDGTAEPRVRDLRLDDVYDFRIGHWQYGDCREVPLAEARRDTRLHWVVNGPYPLHDRYDESKTKLRAVIVLVPVREWERVNQSPIGAHWDRIHEADILRLARIHCGAREGPSAPAPAPSAWRAVGSKNEARDLMSGSRMGSRKS